MESAHADASGIGASTSSPPPPSMAPLFHVDALLPSSMISPKIDSVLHSHIYPQVGHVFRAVAKLRALLVDILSKKRTPSRAGGGYATRAATGYYRSGPAARSGKRSKIAGFVKLQFAWAGASSSSAHLAKHYSYYYDSAWDVAVPAEDEVRACGDDTAECGYLCWLEEERSGGAPAAAEEGGGDAGGGDGESAVNEIDRLAEKFIERFHAKFLLEKQESYRRYQEMMARSV